MVFDRCYLAKMAVQLYMAAFVYLLKEVEGMTCSKGVYRNGVPQYTYFFCPQGCCGAQCCTEEPDDGIETTVIIPVAIVITFVVLSIAVCVVYCCVRVQRGRATSTSRLTNARDSATSLEPGGVVNPYFPAVEYMEPPLGMLISPPAYKDVTGPPPPYPGLDADKIENTLTKY